MMQESMKKMIRFILSPYCAAIDLLYGLSRHMSSKIKRLLLIASVTGLSMTGILEYTNYGFKDAIHFDYIGATVAGAVFFLLILTASIDKKTDICRMDPDILFWAGWFICFALMFVMSFIHPVRKEYFIWSILGLTVFPMIMIAWRQHDDIYGIAVTIARCMVVMSFIYLLMNITAVGLTVPGLQTLDYSGIATNPNGNGMVCLAFFPAALFLLLNESRDRFAYILSLFICIMFSVISVSRASELCLIADTIIAFGLLLRHREYHRTKTDVKSIVLAIIAAAALSIAAGYLLMSLDKTDIRTYAVTDYEEAVEWVYSDDARIKINELSSGRLIIWRAYFRNITLLGKGSPDGPLMPEYYASKWAHNNALDIGYASGAIAMAGYIIWLIAAIRFVIRCLGRKSRYRPEYMFTALAFTAYFIEAMLEITLYPTTTGIAALAFLTLWPVAFRESA